MSPELESICILDDDASVRHSIVQLLDSDGLTALSFENEEAFFANARNHAAPLAVLDVWMPETSGLQVQARLHEMSPGTKVIVMTGRETSAIRAAALDQLRNKLGSGVVVVGSASNGNVSLIAGVTKDLTSRIQAGKVVGAIAEKVGGKGGGRPDLAEAGGKNPEALDSALADVYNVVELLLG